MLTRLLDGFKSLLCALGVLIITGVPAWFAHLAIAAALVPAWGYVFVTALVLCAGIIAFDFLKKTLAGIAPTRSRRR